jgi:hypothetical protein
VQSLLEKPGDIVLQTWQLIIGWRQATAEDGTEQSVFQRRSALSGHDFEARAARGLGCRRLTTSIIVMRGGWAALLSTPALGTCIGITFHEQDSDIVLIETRVNQRFQNEHRSSRSVSQSFT